MALFFQGFCYMIIFLAPIRFEKHYGNMADASLCVTKAMQHELAQNWGIK